MNDLISRQAAIDALVRYTHLTWEHLKIIYPMLNVFEKLPSAERHEQITSEMDEIFRIASEIRLAVGCNTSRECWELARKGDIQRVRHGHWINVNGDGTAFRCSVCGEISCCNSLFCGDCGAKMDGDTE